MKNKGINILIFLITILLFANYKVYAFPDSLTTIYQSGSAYKGAGGYRAAVKRSSNGYLTLCTDYNKNTPAAGRVNCSRYDNWNVPTKAAVASIIKNAGLSSSLTQSNQNYVTTELTLSEYLYRYAGGSSNISDRRVNESWITAAVNEYNAVNTALNNLSVNFNSISYTEDSEAFYLSISLSTPYATYQSINYVSHGGTRLSDGRYKILKSNLSEGNNTITITGAASYYRDIAQAYYCGSYQVLTPNNTEWTQLKYVTKNGTINLTKRSKGKIKIEKRNSVNNNLIQATSIFELYKGSNCSGTPLKNNISTSSGTVTISDLDPGTYSIKEIGEPSGYVKLSDSQKCVKTSVNVSNSTETLATIYNEPTCQTKLSLLGSSPTAQQLLELYGQYPGNTNLLNFDSPSCSPASCNNLIDNSTVSCLNLTQTSSGFSENNLSCYDNSKQDYQGKYIGFCKNTLDLNNKLGVNDFYSKAGQFLIKYDSGIHYIYNSNYELIPISTPYLADATVTHTCYVIDGNSHQINTDTDVPKLNLYFGFDKEELITTKTNTPIVSTNINGVFSKYEYIDIYSFNLKDVYLEKITGKKLDEETDKTNKISGLISNFNKNNGFIPFKLKYDNVTHEYNNMCLFHTTPEIIKYENKPEGTLELEFRSIDKKDPFDRKTNSNWCDGTNCDLDNNTVKEIIKGRNDSYNSTGAGALYSNQADGTKKIILTPDIIQRIREYNDTIGEYNNYTNYTIEENGILKISTDFLDKFEIKKTS